MEKLKVLIDARSVEYSWHRGIGRTFKELAKALSGEVELTALLINPVAEKVARFLSANKIKWTNETSLKFDSYDVYHIIDPMSIYHGIDSPFLMPVKASAKTATFYDLIPQRGYQGGYASWPKPVQASYNQRLIALGALNKFFCISRAVQKDFIDAHNVSTIELGTILEPINKGDCSEMLKLIFSKNYKYFLTVGGCEPHKNLLFMKEVYLALKGVQPDIKWLVATHDSQWFEVMNFTSLPGIIPVTNASDYELQLLYKNARCLCFPSLVEGLGLPPFEAAQFGTPSLCSELPCLPDDFVKLPFKISEWVNELNAIFNIPERLDTSYIKQTTWKTCAGNYVKEWNQILKRT